MTLIQDSPILQDLLAEKFEQGQRKGKQAGKLEGQHEATLESLHQILRVRFQVDAAYLPQKGFEQLDLDKLKKLQEVALTVQTLAEFEAFLSKSEESAA